MSDARLQAAYARWAEVPALDAAEEAVVRDPKDAFGFDQSYPLDPNDTWSHAKQVTTKLLNFLNLLRLEEGLSPKEMVYAQELMALNTFNLADIPLPAAEVALTRQAAFEYYRTNR